MVVRITFTNELAPNKGVKVAGKLPAAIQWPTTYAGPTVPSVASEEAPRAFLRRLAGAEARATIVKAGLEPLTGAR